MADEKPNMEFSDLTGRATQDGVTVTVNVYLSLRRLSGPLDAGSHRSDRLVNGLARNLRFRPGRARSFHRCRGGGGRHAGLPGAASDAALTRTRLFIDDRGRVTRKA